MPDISPFHILSAKTKRTIAHMTGCETRWHVHSLSWETENSCSTANCELPMEGDTNATENGKAKQRQAQLTQRNAETNRVPQPMASFHLVSIRQPRTGK